MFYNIPALPDSQNTQPQDSAIIQNPWTTSLHQIQPEQWWEDISWQPKPGTWENDPEILELLQILESLAQ
jgi:hypothetical protein